MNGSSPPPLPPAGKAANLQPSSPTTTTPETGPSREALWERYTTAHRDYVEGRVLFPVVKSAWSAWRAAS